MTELTTLLATLSVSVLLMTIVFVFAKRMKRYDLVDAAWGWAFIAMALTSYLLSPLDGNRFVWGAPLLATILVVIWGLRLSWHIGKRIAASEQEDERYVELRTKWKGDVHLNTYLRVYLTQAVLAFIIIAPVTYLNLYGFSVWQLDWDALSELGKLMWLTPYIGALIWLAGFTFESLADRQLRRFVSNPKHDGQLMQSGLWRYSRHPNYFGELTQWWGLFVMALSLPHGWITVVGPLTLTILILFVSGIPLTEKRFQNKPGWMEYRRRTSPLIPLPPKTE